VRFIGLNKRMAVDDAKPVERALKLQLEVNHADNSKPIANAIQLAEVYFTQGDYYSDDIPNRIEIYKKVLDLLGDIPDKTIEIQHTLTKTNQRIGTNYMWMGDRFAKDGDGEKSLENYRLALPYTEKMFESTKNEIATSGTTQNLQRVLAGCNQNLGENYLKLGENRKGLEMLLKGLEITMDLAKADPKNTEAQIDVANSYISVSDAYQKLGDFQKSIAANENALEVFRKSFSADKKNIEVADSLIRRMDQETKLLEQAKRPGVAKANRQKLEELCKSEIPNGECFRIGLAK
jgi:tetratricopeptide (TPR) repeat protein